MSNSKKKNKATNLSEKDFYKTYFKYVLNINLIIIMIFDFKFYIISLRKCYGDIHYCFSNEMTLHWFIKIILLYFSTFITSIFIFLSIHKFISKYYLVSICISHLITALIEKGIEPSNHGLVNTIFLPFTLLFFLILLEMIYNIFKCFKKNIYIFYNIY